MIAAVLKISTTAPAVSNINRAPPLGANGQVTTATKMTASHKPMTNADAILISYRCMASILSFRLLTSTLPL
jgi:hypothetical protein